VEAADELIDRNQCGSAEWFAARAKLKETTND
jgi:hypothetical protein